jgi:simple sugar transport system ATP-binding protein
VGENGAGKSTLMNILFGMSCDSFHRRLPGRNLIDGQRAEITSPSRPWKLGIGMVHQEFMLLPNYTITENIKLNREVLKAIPVSRLFGKKLKTLDFKTMNADARKALGQPGYRY